MNHSHLYTRNIEARLRLALGRSPIIFIKGPRQSGKTTLIKQLQNYHFVTLDDVRFLQAAMHDPMGFIDQLPKPCIIDEIQRVPDLFLAIKHDIDQHRIFGRYILTGSADPLLMSQVADSLAGRVEILTLYPFSQGELQGIRDSFVDRIWSDTSLMQLEVEKINQQTLFHRIATGGYPAVQNRSALDQEQWFHDYISTILQKDMLDLANIEHIREMPKLLALCAVRAGSLVNVSELSRDAGISVTTLNRYIAMLEALFIMILQPAWSSNVTQRAIKSPKSYLVDTGLLCWLRFLTAEKILSGFDHDKGHLLENFVINEIMKQITWNTVRARLYHFRSTAQFEVDLVLERLDGKIIGIEIKSNQHVSIKDCKGLQYLQDAAGAQWHRGIVLYTGDVAVPLAQDIIALPITALWAK